MRGLGGHHAPERRGARAPGVKVEGRHRISSRPVSSRKTSSRVRWPRASDSGRTSFSSHQCETTAQAGGVGRPGDHDGHGVEQRHVDELAQRLLQRLGGVGGERPGHHQPDRRRAATPGELERRTAGDEAAVVDDVDVVCEALGLVHVVRGQHDRHAGGAQLLEELPRRAARGRVHAGRRLVDEDDLGPADDGHRQGEALLLAAGEPAVGRAAALAEPQPVGEGLDVERMGVQPRDVAQHLVGVHPAPRAAVLEHHTDAGEQRTAVTDGVEPEHPDRARVWGAVALGGLQGRGLTGTVGAEDGGDRRRLHGQRQVVDGDLVAVAHHQVLDGDGRGWR